jgi:hypothetical protein
MVLPDGSPLPDFSDMLTMDELSDMWREGKLPDLVTVETLFGDLRNIVPQMLEDDLEIDLAAIGERLKSRTVLASGAPPIEPVASDTGDTWANVSRDVVAWVRSHVRALRIDGARGHLTVLAPSPGTGKSRGMMEAADEEQGARRRVGYAVLSRAQIPEVAERLRATNPQVRLTVIEGRHSGNCSYMEQIEVATSAGFAPGSTVCPSCEKYPRSMTGHRDICRYYGSRLEAYRERRKAEILRYAPPIILTTHASAIQGSHIVKRRFQSFWEFDTLFLDEDPTSSMVTTHEISESALNYSQLDHKGNPDGPTLGTRLLREAMERALREREAAAERGFVVHRVVQGQTEVGEDRIHSREHGSSYAGGDLHALLETIARGMGSSLRALGSSTIDGMSGAPPKGEIMNLTADEVATRYPNRYLAALFATLEEESVAIADAKAAGIDLEPAYRTHLDLVPDGEGNHRAVIRLHLLRGYANGRTNILIGDAYANTQHYEGLFDRHRRDGVVHELKKRAIWPTTSSLIRIVTHAGTKHLRNTTQLFEHLEVKVRPVLELERERKIVFYIHKEMVRNLKEWLVARWAEAVDEAQVIEDHADTAPEKERKNRILDDHLEKLGYAVEHWGGGRGKDVYKDFDTFIGVTEYMPNVGGMIHEANTVASLAAPGNTRVAHWNGYAPRKGKATFANSLANASPFYQAAFHRKATDELAQAVHRIRPAIPSRDGRQKRAYVFGHSVPWSDELIAATAATAVVDGGKAEVDLETEALGRGPRFSITETLGLVSEREVAGAIAEVFKVLECWSHAFAHALLGVPAWAMLEDLVVRGSTTHGGLGQRSVLLNIYLPDEASPIAQRVERPPPFWAAIASQLQRNSSIYLAGFRRFCASLPNPYPRRHRSSWMPRGSNGYEFYGDRDRFQAVLDAFYAPNAERLKF